MANITRNTSAYALKHGSPFDCFRIMYGRGCNDASVSTLKQSNGDDDDEEDDDDDDWWL